MEMLRCKCGYMDGAEGGHTFDCIKGQLKNQLPRPQPQSIDVDFEEVHVETTNKVTGP